MCLAQNYSRGYIAVQERQIYVSWKLNLKDGHAGQTTVTYSYIYNMEYSNVLCNYNSIFERLFNSVYSIHLFMFIWTFSYIIEDSRWQRYYNHKVLHISYVFNVLSRVTEYNIVSVHGNSLNAEMSRLL